MRFSNAIKAFFILSLLMICIINNSSNNIYGRHSINQLKTINSESVIDKVKFKSKENKLTVNVDSKIKDVNTEIVHIENNSTEGIVIQSNTMKIPYFGDKYAIIKNNRIGLNTDLYFGDTTEILDKAAGHYSGSYFPGFGGTILIAGHNQTVFKPLKNIQNGDIITVSTNYGVFEYKVYDFKVLHMDDKTAFDLSQTDKETLVMYTCYPFTNFDGLTKERLFVYAEKVSGENLQ